MTRPIFYNFYNFVMWNYTKNIVSFLNGILNTFECNNLCFNLFSFSLNPINFNIHNVKLNQIFSSWLFSATVQIVHVSDENVTQNFLNMDIILQKRIGLLLYLFLDTMLPSQNLPTNLKGSCLAIFHTKQRYFLSFLS